MEPNSLCELQPLESSIHSLFPRPFETVILCYYQSFTVVFNRGHYSDSSSYTLAITQNLKYCSAILFLCVHWALLNTSLDFSYCQQEYDIFMLGIYFYWQDDRYFSSSLSSISPNLIFKELIGGKRTMRKRRRLKI